LKCHSGAHPDFERSPHAKAAVGCTSCHDIHGSKEEKLLKAAQPTLCFQCHTDEKPQFDMPFHHKVNEGWSSAATATMCTAHSRRAT
jgi:predicted CXXCH cytochrome family protein